MEMEEGVEVEKRRARAPSLVAEEKQYTKAGLTRIVMEKIHDMWRKEEFVRLKFHEVLPRDMRTIHEIVEMSFDRTNLKYGVINKTKEPLKRLQELLRDRFKDQSGIVYCLSKIECVDVAKFRNAKCKVKTVYYHAGVPAIRVLMFRGNGKQERSGLFVQPSHLGWE